MQFSKELSLFLLLGLGVSWTLTYCLIIYRSFKDKTYGMPFVALAFNISWEFYYGFIFIGTKAGLQTYVNRIWFLLDVVILLCYFLYAVKYFTENYRKLFLPYSLFVIGSAAALLYYYQQDTGTVAITYSAFMVNVIISALYIEMLLKRNSIEGQSFGIAVFKCIGTACATAFLFQGFSLFVIMLGLICFALDLIYIVMLAGFYRKSELHLLTRKARSLS